MLRLSRARGDAKLTERYTRSPYGRKISANAFTFCRYSVERIWGEAFTLFSTVPLMPMEALAYKKKKNSVYDNLQ